VAASGTLHLLQQNRFSLDTDVNTLLRTWKVPENEFTKEHKVTLRSILSHSAGLTVHGFPGYAVGTITPSLVQILDGAKPANKPPSAWTLSRAAGCDTQAEVTS
jgi:CubicO group peptidase (beta-lactamase class C family)